MIFDVVRQAILPPVVAGGATTWPLRPTSITTRASSVCVCVYLRSIPLFSRTGFSDGAVRRRRTVGRSPPVNYRSTNTRILLRYIGCNISMRPSRCLTPASVVFCCVELSQFFILRYLSHSFDLRLSVCLSVCVCLASYEPERGQLHVEPHVRPISCHVTSLP